MERSSLPITGVILAGGAGRRMGGADKGFVMWRNRPLLDYAIDTLNGLPQILISANRTLERYNERGYEVVPDEEQGFGGPLMGLKAALARARQPWLLAIPVDAPRLGEDLVERLWRQRHQARVVVGRSARGPEPVICLCHRAVAPTLAAYLEGGGREARRWFVSLPHLWLDLRAEEVANCNTEEDLS